MRTRDIAWLAGLWGGEGTFFCPLPDSKTRSVVMKIMMTDKDVIDRAASLMHPPSIFTAQQGDRKFQYGFGLNGSKAAEWMMTLYPLMGERRQQKIRECLIFWRNQSGKQPKPKLQPCGQTHNSKYCSLCKSIYNRLYKSKKILQKAGYEMKGL